MHRLFTNRRLLVLTIILIISNLIITGVSLVIIYNKSIASLETSLLDIVERQKSLVTVLHEQGKNDQEIIQFIKAMRKKHYSIGKTGEFTIAHQVGDSIIFLLTLNDRSHFAINNRNAQGIPIQLALKGAKGFVHTNDFRKIKVFAAYVFVPELKWGILAKIDASEIYQPYYKTIYIALLINILLITFYVYLFVKISNPIIRGIIKSEEKFRHAIRDAPFPIMIHAENGEVLDISQGWTDISGYSISDIPTTEDWTERAYGIRKQAVKEEIEALYNLEGRKDEGEYPIICKDRSQRVWDFSSAPLGKLDDGRRAVISMAKDVTERKMAEENLKKSEELYHNLFDNMLNGLAYCKMVYNTDQSLDFTYLSVNKAFESLTGLKDVTGKKVSEVIPGIQETDKALLDTYARVADTGNPEVFEMFLEALKMWFFVSVYSPEKGCFVAIFDVITERKQAELELKEKNEEFEAQNEEYLQINEELSQINSELRMAKERTEESEKRLLSIIENTEAGYFFIDNDGLFQRVNRAWLNLYKYSEFDEVIGKHFAEVQQLDDMESAKQFVEGIRSGNPAYMNGNFSRFCKDKTVGYHSFSARPVYSNNSVVGIEGFIIDITKQKEAEFELIKSKEKAERNEQKFRSLFTSMQEGVYLHEIIYDNEGKAIDYRIIEANPISEKYLNIERGNAIGKLATELYGTSVAPFLDIYARVAETCEPVSFEQYFEPMGKYFLISVFSPKKGEFATAFLDITKIKNYENELVEAKEKAEESDRLKTAFIQNISHEIRTPMNAIMGFSELLEKQYNNKTKLTYYSNVINQRCSDLLDIVNEILDIAKIESGQIPVNFEECKLHSLFDELTQFFSETQKRLGKQHIAFIAKANCSFNDSQIITDRVKLKQILINLISNAFKFTDHGEIEAGCKFNDQQQLVFFVSDTGIGIPSDKHDLIFERFAQLNGSKNRIYGGTGLGLSIVKGLVKLLGGEIWLESEPQKGSTFYFTISYKAIEDFAPENTPLAYQSNFDFSNKTILIVEDDIYNTEYIKEILTEINSKVMYATCGKEAIDISLSTQLDLILMDIGLPDMTGYEAIQQIKQHKQELKIIAQTAYATPDDKKKSLKAGCIDYISKPLNRDQFLTIINKYLQ